MANGKSEYLKQMDANSLHARANQSMVNRAKGLARFEYIAQGNEAVNDYIDLGSICVPAFIQPEEIKMRFQLTGVGNITGKFQRVTATGVVTDITTPSNTAMALALSFTAATAGPSVSVEKTDRIRFLFTAITTVPTAGRVIYFEIPYDTI